MSVFPRVLVTGGAGFIGSHLVERLVDSGAGVTVVDNLISGNRANLESVADRVVLIEDDLAALLQRNAIALGAYTHVFHLAANPYIPPSVRDPAFDFQSNLVNTFALLQALRGVVSRPRLINISTAAVYGNPVRLPMQEQDPTFPISPYGVSKLAAERYTAVFSELYELPATSARLLSVYGPRQRKQVVYDLLAKLAANPQRLTVLGDGTQGRDFTYVGDVVSALLILAERAPMRGEVFNVASGITYRIRDLVDVLCRMLEITPEIQYTGLVRQGDTERWEVDISRLRELGYRASTSLEQGVAVTYEWFRHSGAA